MGTTTADPVKRQEKVGRKGHGLEDVVMQGPLEKSRALSVPLSQHKHIPAAIAQLSIFKGQESVRLKY